MEIISEVNEENMIVMDDIFVHYSNGTVALKECNVCVEKGEFLFVVGRSGSGKSTFIKTLLGEVKPISGDVIVGGSKITKLRRKRLPYYRRRVGVVFQEFRLLNDRNVYENVALAQRVIGASEKFMEKRIRNILKLVGLENKINSFPGELSGGEQQRVAIARAMVNKPAILLADEPTGNLDPENSWEIMNLLNEVNKLGTTVLVVTHNNEIVDRMKKRVITLHDGKIVSDVKQGGYLQ